MSLIIDPYRYAAGGGGGGVAPTDLSGLQLWLKADAITGLSDNDQITTVWPDSSGNGRDFSSLTLGSIKPRWKATSGPNSQPAVRMLDTGYFQRSSAFLSGFTAGEGFAVVKIDNDPPATSAKCGPPFGDWGDNFDDYYPYNGDSKIYIGFGSTTRKTTLDPVTSLTTWHLYNCRSSSGDWTHSINAATSTNDFFNTATNTVAWDTTGNIRVGASSSSSKTMEGYIAEIIFYNRILNDTTERKAVVHAYLNTKYAFSLPT